VQFRQKALSKLQSPEELDVPVRFARPQGRLVLAVTILFMAAAGFWAVTGSVTSKLTAPGILTHAEGSYVLQSPVAGQVTKVLTREGATVGEGAPLLAVRTERGTQAVRAVAPGKVTSLVAKIGSVVTPGANVATVERINNADDPIVAMLYVPGDNSSSVRPGADVDLTVQSVPTQQFGVLRGHVKAVGRVPQTGQQITSFLGDSQLGRQFSSNGQPVAVMVRLDPSSSTKSGYTWSSANGPPYRIDSTTLVSGAVHLASQRPVDLLLP
jgi:multidrug efflux pump subunit AcrA (membrane-fusion protein)